MSLIDLCLQLNGKIDLKILDVLLTLREIQEIIYSAESKRTSTLILRYHNVTFQHALLINQVIQKPKSLTSRKLFGHYYHSIIVHSPQQLRVISGPSSNVEDEERTFNFLKTITKATSNHHPENVLLNAMIRIQVKENLATKIYNEINSKISKHDSQIKIQKTNSFFTFKFIRDNKWVYQSHLERIADFLLEGNTWEERENGVEFLDFQNESLKGKRVNHFRNREISHGIIFLKECWELCLKNPNRFIPAKVIKIETDDNIEILELTTLKHFTKNGALNLTPSLNSSHSIDNKGSQIGNNTTLTHDNQNIKTVNDFNMSNVTNSVTSSKILSINDSISSTPYSKYNKSTIIDNNHLSSTPLPNPENKASPINLLCIDDAKTRNTSNNINANKDIYPKNDIVIKYCKQGLPQDNLSDSSLTKTAAILVNLFGELPLIYEYDRARKQFKKDQTFYKNIYKCVAAKIEVKLTNLYNDLKGKLRTWKTNVYWKIAILA